MLGFEFIICVSLWLDLICIVLGGGGLGVFSSSCNTYTLLGGLGLGVGGGYKASEYATIL